MQRDSSELRRHLGCDPLQRLPDVLGRRQWRWCASRRATARHCGLLQAGHLGFRLRQFLAQLRRRSCARADRYAEPDQADGAYPVRQDDQRAHHPQPGPHRGREAGH
ncbi:hypothetical protein AB0P05_41695 [Streptomyces flaveolus]|uniref:hypothetical protein n=1 Tax=Streptomyces flaveolus TaxID=67297 RepID=UPI00344AB68C